LRTSQPRPPPRVQPGDAGRGNEAAGGGETEGLQVVVQLAPGGAALDPRRARHRIDPDRFHGGEIYHHAAVADRAAGDVVAGAADGDEEVVRAGEIHRTDHIGDAGAADDEIRAPVDHRVEDLAGRVVSGVAGADQRAAQTGLELVNRRSRDDGIRHRMPPCLDGAVLVACGRRFVGHVFSRGLPSIAPRPSTHSDVCFGTF
jgi:hypothetical protein